MKMCLSCSFIETDRDSLSHSDLLKIMAAIRKPNKLVEQGQRCGIRKRQNDNILKIQSYEMSDLLLHRHSS